MKYLAPLAGFFLTLSALLAPVLALLAVPFIRWDKEISTARDESGISIIRGDLPQWLRWLQTPDERLPGGMYEPTVLAVYRRWGKGVCSWYWMGLRNTMMGLAVACGRPCASYIPETLGYWSDGNVWRWAHRVGPLKFVTGYQVYKLLDGSFRAAPVFTLKRI